MTKASPDTPTVSLQNKRIIAFVNHFLVTNVQFLNSFFQTCENKLLFYEDRLSRLESSISILESKLSTIPHIKTEASNSRIETNLRPENISEPQKGIQVADEVVEESKTEAIQPEYEKYVKMLQFGVPLEAVKLKINLEGLNVSIFEKFLKK